MREFLKAHLTPEFGHFLPNINFLFGGDMAVQNLSACNIQLCLSSIVNFPGFTIKMLHALAENPNNTCARNYFCIGEKEQMKLKHSKSPILLHCWFKFSLFLH